MYPEVGGRLLVKEGCYSLLPVKMARRDKQEAVRQFEEALEDLTFNSKPLIDHLTRVAGSGESQAAKIVEKLESRLMQTRTDWKLPSLYLLDSIMKNLGGGYRDEISKIIVAVFCHCFEKLLEPDIRKALYKLRLTWTPFVPNRKLAAIDRHVHALDPNWPLLATDPSGPSSPTIFVNPKFLDGSSNSSSSKAKRPSPPKETKKNNKVDVDKPVKVEKTMKRIPKISKSKSPSVSPEKTVVVGGATGDSEAAPLSIHDRRKQILQRVKKGKLAMSQGASTEEARKTLTKRSLSPNPVSNRRAHSKSPKRPRSTSPIATDDKVSKKKKKNLKVSFVVAEKHLKSQEATPPPEKRLKLEESVNAESANIKNQSEKSAKPVPLKEAHLKLDDIPPELLRKHQERIKKQNASTSSCNVQMQQLNNSSMEEHLNSGQLSSEQHETIVQQLDKLYELQELKKKNGNEGAEDKDKDSSRTQTNSLETHSSRPIAGTSCDMLDIHAQSNGPRSERFNEPVFRDRERMSRGRGRRPSPRLLPPPFEPYPNERGFPPPPPPSLGPPPPDYYRGFHPRGRRGDFRPPPPRGPEWMERGRGRFDGPPRGRGRALPGPPPPRLWPEPMDMNGPPPPHLGPPPPPVGLPLGGPPPPPLPNKSEPNVSMLLSKLVDAGLIGGEGPPKMPTQPPAGERETPPTQRRQTPPPLSVPHLSLTPATLQQRYTILITLLHSGVPCTSCGLRFKSESAEEYRHHLDWHYQVNRREKDGTARSARNWFMHPEDWLSFEELAHNTTEKELTLEPELPDRDFREKSDQPSEIDVISCRVLPGETSDEVCSICQEPLEQFWEENDEEWHFKDAMRNDAEKLFHVFCYKDAKESGTLDNSGSQLPSPTDTKGENPEISA